MRILLLIALLVTCSGCVVWYKDFPRPAVTSGQQGATDMALPAHPGFEHCQFRTGVSASAANADVAFQGVKWLTLVGLAFVPVYPLEGMDISGKEMAISSSWYVLHSDSLNMQVPVQGGGKVVFMSDLSEVGVMPEEGLICEARIAFPYREVGHLRGLNGLASAITLFILVPWLGLPDTVEYSVSFVVSNPQGLTREYRYSFHKAGISWAALLPFAWINFFTSSEEEAFQAVFQQFLFDFQRDRAAMVPERQSQTR
ncbi:MAG: hypothetical protein OEV08_10925 [Nitrospira sp.]|nr:hypothetical protein [Nitrospira sp.]